MSKVKNKRKSKNLNGKKTAIVQTKEQEIQEESVVGENTPIVFSWITVDFKRKPLTEFYFIAAAIGAMAMIGWGVYNRNFVMVITFIVMVVVIILVLNDEPRKVAVKISEDGIDLNGQHYNYSDFKSFKISSIDEMPVLTFRHRKSFSLIKTIYTEKEPINDLEVFLGIYLEKEEDMVKEA